MVVITDPAVNVALAELKRRLTALYGNRLRALYLYGSYARGEQTKDSDIDTMLVLEGDVNPGEEIDRVTPILSELCLNHDLLISLFPVSRSAFATRQSPVLINARNDGVAL